MADLKWMNRTNIQVKMSKIKSLVKMFEIKMFRLKQLIIIINIKITV